jgi:hypothetical protein
MGRMSRNKGARGEREFLELLGTELGEMLARNLQQTRGGGADCLMVKGWAIEVKRCESLSRPTWWRQAVKQAEREGVQPMLAYRRNKEPWRVWIKEGCDISVESAACAIREKLLGWP